MIFEKENKNIAMKGGWHSLALNKYEIFRLK
jgi:hypothetical protein